MKVAFGFLATIVMSVAAGCGSAAAGSCTTTSGSTMSCVDYGGTWNANSVMQGCTGSGQTYSASACTSTNRVGRCTVTSPAGGATTTTNYYAPATASDVMTACGIVSGMYEAN